MGTTYQAYAILGMKFSKDELFKPTKVKKYEHNFPETWNVDPVTGEKLWNTLQLCILTKTGYDYEKLTASLSLIKDYENNYYVGLATSQTIGYYRANENNFIQQFSIEKIKKELQDFLEPHQLWFPKRFGMYAVQAAQ